MNALSITKLPVVQKALQQLRRHGAANAGHVIAVRLANRIAPFKILRGVQIAQPRSAFLACPEHYTAGFLSAKALYEFAADPATEMSREFLDAALACGDRCYAILHGGKLAAYGWYSTRPTPVGPPHLVLHFAPGYVYMYKGFTDARYRGQRLHAIAMTRALAHYRSSGNKGMVSYVESTNFDSLKSCFRMGYEVFGSVYLLRLFGRDATFSSRGCARFDFRVEVSGGGADLARGKT